MTAEEAIRSKHGKNAASEGHLFVIHVPGVLGTHSMEILNSLFESVNEYISPI